jgi:hypothetical protein
MYPDLGSGILTGAGLCGAVVGVLWLLGYYRVTAVNGFAAVVPLFAASAGSAYVEEIVARGIVFRIMEEGLGTWLALTVSALLFGLVHIFNPNATILGALAIALTAGVILGAGYCADPDLVAAHRHSLRLELHAGRHLRSGSLR